MKKKTKEVSFSRPAFFAELNNPETEKRFNELPAWSRHLVKRLIDHGDLQRAATEAGVSRHAKDVVDLKAADRKSMVEALEHGGITPQTIVAHLMECLEAKGTRVDKHGDPFPYVDLNLKLKTVELIMKARGDLSKEKPVDDEPRGEELFENTPI